MIRTFTLAVLAAGPALAHSGHGAPAGHSHLADYAAFAAAVVVSVIAARVWRAR